MGTFVRVVLPLFMDLRNVNFSQKPLYLCIPLAMPIGRICMTLGLYISPVNDSIDLIMLIGFLYQVTISTYRLID